LAVAKHIEGVHRASRRRQPRQDAFPGERAARQVVQQHDRALWPTLGVLYEVAQDIVNAAHGPSPRRTTGARRLWRLGGGLLRWIEIRLAHGGGLLPTLTMTIPGASGLAGQRWHVIEGREARVARALA